MANVYRYVPGMLQIDETGELYLPHSCDRWNIGGENATKALIADLQHALTGFYEPSESYEDAYLDLSEPF